MVSFLIEGGKPLKGEISISGSKNASLPILAATLLTDEPCVIKNIPDIEDVRTMIEILKSLGKGIEFSKNTVTVWKGRPTYKPVPKKLACMMRASVLLLGPLLARFSKASIPFPGGCVLGKRPFTTHLEAFSKFGVENESTEDELRLKLKDPLCGRKVVLHEFSVTATENILLLASLASGVTEIHLAAIEPHVQDLCHFLQKIGVSIQGIGTHTLRVTGAKKLRGTVHEVIPDYLEAGTFAIAVAVTNGEAIIKDFEPKHLEALFHLFEMIGVPVEFGSKSVKIKKRRTLQSCQKLQTAIYPGFPTDLQAPFSVLLTQCEGETLIHETLFEGRLQYLHELQKMGAKIEVANEHEARVTGPTRLRGTQVESCDIRAGAAMIVAGLAASGKTEVLSVTYLDRGYERFDEKLRDLGASIERLGEPAKRRLQPSLEYQFDIPVLPLR